jgi:hypothetical protein
MTLSVPNPFTAKWTATGSNICLGHWEISYLGQALELDSERREHDMGTYAIYSFIFPDDEMYAEGLPEEEWIIANLDWLTSLFIKHDIPADAKHFRLFYQAVNKQDWRCGSCGGCI